MTSDPMSGLLILSAIGIAWLFVLCFAIGGAPSIDLCGHVKVPRQKTPEADAWRNAMRQRREAQK